MTEPERIDELAPPACINCGKPAGQVQALEKVRPFCPACWQVLYEYFAELLDPRYDTRNGT